MVNKIYNVKIGSLNASASIIFELDESLLGIQNEIKYQFNEGEWFVFKGIDNNIIKQRLVITGLLINSTYKLKFMVNGEIQVEEWTFYTSLYNLKSVIKPYITRQEYDEKVDWRWKFRVTEMITDENGQENEIIITDSDILDSLFETLAFNASDRINAFVNSTIQRCGGIDIDGNENGISILPQWSIDAIKLAAIYLVRDWYIEARPNYERIPSANLNSGSLSQSQNMFFYELYEKAISAEIKMKLRQSAVINIARDPSITISIAPSEYVTIHSPQEIYGKKIFMTQVKGKPAIEDDEFVTKSQLSIGGGDGNFVTIDTDQTILGKKTFTQPIIAAPANNDDEVIIKSQLDESLDQYVDTISNQTINGYKVFLNRIKGVEGVEPHDLVTMSQLGLNEDDFVTINTSQMINGQKEFVLPVRGAEALNDNEFVTKSQLDNLNVSGNFVTIDTTQTITGVKTFTQPVYGIGSGYSNAFTLNSQLNDALDEVQEEFDLVDSRLDLLEKASWSGGALENAQGSTVTATEQLITANVMEDTPSLLPEKVTWDFDTKTFIIYEAGRFMLNFSAFLSTQGSDGSSQLLTLRARDFSNGTLLKEGTFTLPFGFNQISKFIVVDIPSTAIFPFTLAFYAFVDEDELNFTLVQYVYTFVTGSGSGSSGGNYVTVDTPQTITGKKTFTQTTLGIEGIEANSFTTLDQVVGKDENVLNSSKIYADQNFVGLIGDNTISGIKTFTNPVKGVEAVNTDEFVIKSQAGTKLFNSSSDIVNVGMGQSTLIDLSSWDGQATNIFSITLYVRHSTDTNKSKVKLINFAPIPQATSVYTFEEWLTIDGLAYTQFSFGFLISSNDITLENRSDNNNWIIFGYKIVYKPTI